MNRQAIKQIPLVALAFVSACATPPTKQEIGTVSGAVIGGIVGSSLT